TAIVPPRNVLRFIECSRCALFFQAYWMNNAVITTYFVPRNPSHLVVYGPRPLSNPPQRRQDNLRRQRNFGDYGPERGERVVDRIGHRRRRAGGPGLARALGAELRL